MMPTVYLEKLYGYKRIYSNIYIVCLDNGQIIYVWDIRFYKEDPSVGEVDEKVLLEVIFDEKIEGFVFGEVIFDSDDRLLLSRILRPLRFQ